ncbi:hypothetical protein RFI_30983 [Reticulomyxa filosa]|uniref:Uncharacterized protein n=1 Tax=Reticulomyxa filosa TaxID=46433 RepID=X6LWX7_RETFI|nr:hypothetical protein RFI_30983 [Reticulomyxa filosa]|eukprot:ETO06413.1 hypothetical protein RFI_30983 [Reticulomyxa filosa]
MVKLEKDQFFSLLNYDKHKTKYNNCISNQLSISIVCHEFFSFFILNVGCLNSSMKSSLVLVVLHVLNVFVVMLNKSETNTSGTNRQKHFNRYINMDILTTSCDMLFNRSINNVWKLEMWNCEQSLQLYNNMASVSSLQISKNESMQSTNQIIRIFQSTPSANIKQSKKNRHSKTSTINIFISTSAIQLTTYKWTSTSLIFRYITATERLMKKKMIIKKKGEVYVYQKIGRGEDELCMLLILFRNDFLKKNKNYSVLRNGKVDVIISTLRLKRARSEYLLGTLAVINCFWYNATTSKDPIINIICSRCKYFFSSIKHKIAQSPAHIIHNFAAILKRLSNAVMLSFFLLSFFFF